MRVTWRGALHAALGGGDRSEPRGVRAVRAGAGALLLCGGALLAFSVLWSGDDDEDAAFVRAEPHVPVGHARAPQLALLPEVLDYELGGEEVAAAERDAEGKLEGDRSGESLGYLTACVMAKDAADALPEFVARNHLAGVDHFVIMDDSAPDAFEHLHRVLEPLSAIVTLVRVSRTDATLAKTRGWSSASQIRSLVQCADSVRGRTTWVAFVDVDEFFEADDPAMYGLDTNAGAPFMRTFLQEAAKNESKPAVCVKWRTVLTNGRVDPPPCGTTLATYFPKVCNVTGKDGHPLARRKAIVRADWLDVQGTPMDDSYGHIGYRFLPPHHGFRCIDDPAPEEVFIMHYWSMSLMDYLRKIARGRPRRSLEQRTMFDLLWREQMCDLKMDDESSQLRDPAVRDLINGFGFTCKAVDAKDAAWNDEDDENLKRIAGKDRAALRFLVEKQTSGQHFNTSKYSKNARLKYKSVYGGFLAVIDMIPWVHYYLHGYDPSTADQWFD